MTIRKERLSMSRAAKYGQRVRGVEALEARTVLSASLFPSYLGPSAPAPPKPFGEPIAPATVQEYDRGGYDPDGPLESRFEPHRGGEYAPAPWQVTIILLPTTGLTFDRGSSYLIENTSLARSNQAPAPSGQQATYSYSSHEESLRELRKLDGLELEALAVTPVNASSSLPLDSGMTGAPQSSSEESPFRHTVSMLSAQASQRATADEQPQPEGPNGKAEAESDRADSPLPPRRKRNNSAGLTAGELTLPRAINFLDGNIASSPRLRAIWLPVEHLDEAQTPAPQIGAVGQAGAADEEMIELLAEDIVTLMLPTAPPSGNVPSPNHRPATVEWKLDAGPQLYQVFDVGDNTALPVQEIAAAPATRPDTAMTE